MYIITPVLKTSRRLLLWNSARYTFPNKAVFDLLFSAIAFFGLGAVSAAVMSSADSSVLSGD